MKDEIIFNDEVSKNKRILEINNVLETWKSTVKIELTDGGKASGFLIKYQREQKPFYCLMTNEHVISPEMTDNGEEILIKFENEKKYLKIKLNQKERIIVCLKDMLNIDLTIIEIIPKDNIDDSYFLLPNIKYRNKFRQLKEKDIQILQFPGGKKLSLSEGKLLGFSGCMFYHNASTQFGSSGSPIFLKDEEGVIGIHRGATEDKTKNVGYHIFGFVLDIIYQLKRNGEGIEYYDNGKIKYEGNFVNDKYEGEGKFYETNGEIYIGQFKKGEKHGNGCIIKDGYIIFEGQFNNGYPKKKIYSEELQIQRYPKIDFEQIFWSAVGKKIGTEIGKGISNFLFGGNSKPK